MKENIINDLKCLNKPFKLYFDTEFTGLHKKTDLISIGITSQFNDVFYAELTDYDESMVDDWIKDNVINNLVLDAHYVGNKYQKFVKGNKRTVFTYLLRWLNNLYETNIKNSSEFDHIQFVSDVSHYDFVLLIDLLADNALKLPEFISPVCHDINQDIAAYYHITDIDAFNVNREQLIVSLINELHHKSPDKIAIEMTSYFTDNGIKHNALWDANVIMAIYTMMHERFLYFIPFTYLVKFKFNK